jgi:hypothetical protein
MRVATRQQPGFRPWKRGEWSRARRRENRAAHHGKQEKQVPRHRERTLPGPTRRKTDYGQVFWLPDRPRTAPSRKLRLQWPFAIQVPGYSGGTAAELHRFPYSSAQTTNPS